jgi:hypothetical protein
VFVLRDRPLLRTIVSPVSDGFSVIFCTVAVIGVAAETTTWWGAAAAAFLVVFFVRSHAARVRVDVFGIAVTNRFVKHRIPWDQVTGVWGPEPDRYDFIRTLRVERRRGALFSVSVVAALGMSREQLRLAAHDLAELARQHGADIKAAGSAAEVEAQLTAKPPHTED